MLGTYIFYAICLGGVAFLCCCFVAFYREDHRTRSTYSVGVYSDEWHLAAGHHCVVPIIDGKRTSAARLHAPLQSGRSATSGVVTFIPMRRLNGDVH
jgi:hypothetical protein